MRRMEEKRVSRPQAWRCPKAGVAVTVVSGGSSWAAQRGLGAGRLPAWASGEEGVSRARQGGFPFAVAARAESAVRDRATAAHSQVPTARLRAGRRLAVRTRPG